MEEQANLENMLAWWFLNHRIQMISKWVSCAITSQTHRT